MLRGVATTPIQTPGEFEKPYYVTTPIFYVNAGKRISSLLGSYRV
jgi:hypothetical protein